MKSIMFYLGYIPRRRVMEQIAYCQVRLNNNPFNSFNHDLFLKTNTALLEIDAYGYTVNPKTYFIGYVTKRNILSQLADLETEYSYYELEQELNKRHNNHNTESLLREMVIKEIRGLIK